MFKIARQSISQYEDLEYELQRAKTRHKAAQHSTFAFYLCSAIKAKVTRAHRFKPAR